jgi:group I intron endonuclease
MKKEKQMVIYKITNVQNGKFYIGSAVDYELRIKTHINDLKKSKHHSSKLQRSYNKYGLSVFKFEIIETVLDVNLLIETEQKWFDKLNPELNMTLIAGLNSHLGMKRSTETKNKISVKLTGIIRSVETKNKISKSKLGVSINGTNMNKDKIGKPLSKEQKNKISIGNKGKILTEETKKKISETLKNKKLISSVAIIVEKYSLDDKLIKKYDTMTKAEIENGYGRNSLRYHILVKNKIEYNGFKWVITKK